MSDGFTEEPSTRLSTVRERAAGAGTRRGFLRTVASAGYAAGIAHVLGVDEFLSADDGDVEVVTALVRADPDDPWSLAERTRTVPRDWYEAVQKAFELNDLLAKLRVPGYLGSTVVPGSYDSGTASVSIGVSSESGTLRDLVSAVRDGISVNVELIESFEEGRDSGDVEPRYLSNVRGDAVPSGVAVRAGDSLATLGPALYHESGEGPFFTTAQHAYAGSDDPRGEALRLPIELGDEAVDIGTVRYSHPVEDVVAVEPGGWTEPGRLIDEPTPVEVNGQYTRWGLADLVARDERLEKVGAMTGYTSGAIQGIDAITCFTDEFCRRGQIRWGGEMDLIDGDSGSVSYHPDPEDPDGGVLIAGFNNARTWWPGQSYVWGVSAYHLFERQGYHF